MVGEVQSRLGKAYYVAVLLRATPDVTIAPFAQFSEFLDLLMRMLHVIFGGQSRGVVDPNIASESK